MKVDQHSRRNARHDALTELVEQFLPDLWGNSHQWPRDADHGLTVEAVPNYERLAANAELLTSGEESELQSPANIRFAPSFVLKIARKVLVSHRLFANFFCAGLSDEPF